MNSSLLRIATLGLLATGCADSELESTATASDESVSAHHTRGFVEVTTDWSVDFVHDSGLSPEKHLPETMGGGVALFDLEGDGDLDLYFVQSGPVPTRANATGSPTRPVNRLFRNRASGQFEDATKACGAAAHDGCGMGVATGDVDGDGDVDLFVTNFGPDILLENRGDGSFDDASARSGIADDRWTAGATLFDADADGDLDLFVTAYVAIDVEHPTWCGRREPGWRSFCHPDHYSGLRDRFWRNLGDGHFADESGAAGFTGLIGKGLGVIPIDFDADGDLDLYVANDSVENHLWSNSGDGHFEDATLLSGTGVNGLGATEAGMGLACGDVDGDLDLDLLVTNFDHESNTLYINLGDGLFRDATVAAGLEAVSRLPVGFGCVLDDLDQDGALDLAVVNGHIIDNVELYDDAQSWRQPAQLFRGDGAGGFRELDAQSGGFDLAPLVGRGLVSGDLDGDGDLDLVLTQCGGAALVLRNDFATGRSLELRGLTPGTRVEVSLVSGGRLLRVAGPAASYFGASHPCVHIGLGEDAVSALRIYQPGQAARDVRFETPMTSGVWFAKDSANRER